MPGADSRTFGARKDASLRRLAPKSPSEALQPEPAPEPPQRSKRARHPIVVVLNGVLTIVVLLMLVAGVGIYFGKALFEAPGPLAQDRTIMVTRGMNAQTIADNLTSKGIISNRYIFLGGLHGYQANAKLKAGEYLIEANSSMKDIMETLVEGRSILHTVTVPEGWTSQQIVEHIRADSILTGDINEVPPEGALLPETYKFTRGQTRQQLIDNMVKSHQSAVEEVWARRADGLPVSTPEELVILASIVEKETGKADERTRVAAVFINRLNKNMRLQSDPTILYGLYRGEAWGKPRTILRSELNAPNEYNTYQINGLPPGPIANPGKAALEAVANPSRTNDLYFVADGTGGHVFAETLVEHNRNVQKWRAIERQKRSNTSNSSESSNN